MGKCEFVDDSANFLDGYHCKLLGGKVNDYSLTRCYCNASYNCRHCPVRGGDDRLRKPRQEPAPAPTPAPRRRDDSEDSDRSARSHSTGGSSGGSSWLIWPVVVLIFVMVTISQFKPEVFESAPAQSAVHAAIELPETMDHEDLTLQAVSCDAATLYRISSVGFAADGSAAVPVEDGRSDIYLTYDDASILVGDVTVSSGNSYRANHCDYGYLKVRALRVLVFTLKDSDGTPIDIGDLTVDAGEGRTEDWSRLAPGQYAVTLSDDAVKPGLTLNVPGYEPVTVEADLSCRLRFLEITLDQDGGVHTRTCEDSGKRLMVAALPHEAEDVLTVSVRRMVQDPENGAYTAEDTVAPVQSAKNPMFYMILEETGIYEVEIICGDREPLVHAFQADGDLLYVITENLTNSGS